MKAVIFDLDGTLVDSAADIHAAANALLRSMGYQPMTPETIRGFVGNGVPKLVERVMREAGIEYTLERHAGLTATFERLYGEKPVAYSVLYPGVRDALEVLKQRGYVMGVCTNKVHAITVQVLEGLRIDGYFDVVIGGDSLPVHKPDPAPLFACIEALGADQVVFVGDSEVDGATAEAAKVPFALYTNGYRKKPVAEIPHTANFTNFADLAGFLGAVGEKTVKL